MSISNIGPSCHSIRSYTVPVLFIILHLTFYLSVLFILFSISEFLYFSFQVLLWKTLVLLLQMMQKRQGQKHWLPTSTDWVMCSTRISESLSRLLSCFRHGVVKYYSSCCFCSFVGVSNTLVCNYDGRAFPKASWKAVHKDYIYQNKIIDATQD